MAMLKNAMEMPRKIGMELRFLTLPPKYDKYHKKYNTLIFYVCARIFSACCDPKVL